MADANDMDLGREFAGQNSEAAFAELERRHINLVYPVVLRFTGSRCMELPAPSCCGHRAKQFRVCGGSPPHLRWHRRIFPEQREAVENSKDFQGSVVVWFGRMPQLRR